MKEVIKLKFIHWVKAKVSAHENSKLLIADYEKYRHICTQNMVDLSKAEWELYKIEDEPELPQAYKRWMQARRDQACSTCWLSSIKAKNHTACNIKLEEYFASDEALQEFILNELS